MWAPFFLVLTRYTQNWAKKEKLYYSFIENKPPGPQKGQFIDTYEEKNKQEQKNRKKEKNTREGKVRQWQVARQLENIDRKL